MGSNYLTLPNIRSAFVTLKYFTPTWTDLTYVCHIRVILQLWTSLEKHKGCSDSFLATDHQLPTTSRQIQTEEKLFCLQLNLFAHASFTKEHLLKCGIFGLVDQYWSLMPILKLCKHILDWRQNDVHTTYQCQ